MTTNLKIDKLEAASLKLNGKEVSEVASPEEVDQKVEARCA